MRLILRCESCRRIVIRKRWCKICVEANHALESAAAADSAIRDRLYPARGGVEIVRSRHPSAARSWTPSWNLIDGRYRLGMRLGAGGMATVFRSRDLLQEQEVAVKVLHQALADDEIVTERFRREASRARGLCHPNIVRVFDHGVWGKLHYIVMEYVRGRTLRALISSEAPLPPSRAVEIALQILEAVRFTHSRGILHRDLKSGNVIVDRHGRVKVTDFGTACDGMSDITPPGSIVGTAEYLSPERALGEPATEASDIYSIGVILHELVTGRLPFETEFVSTLALKHLGEAPRPPAQVNPDLSPDLDAIVMRALEKSPADRFPDTRSFSAALRREARRPATNTARPTAAWEAVAVAQSEC